MTRFQCEVSMFAALLVFFFAFFCFVGIAHIEKRELKKAKITEVFNESKSESSSGFENNFVF